MRFRMFVASTPVAVSTSMLRIVVAAAVVWLNLICWLPGGVAVLVLKFHSPIEPVGGCAAIAVATKAVVATEVSLSPAVGVGAVGLPVKAGEAIFALSAMAVACAVESGLLASLVLSTLPNPTAALFSGCHDLSPRQ